MTEKMIEKKNNGILGMISNGVSFVEENLSAVFMGLAVCFMFWEVIARYFLKLPVYVTNDWTPFLTTWAMLIGNAVLVRTRGHVAITMLPGAMKKEPDKLWLRLYIDAIILIFCGYFLYSSYLAVEQTYKLKIVSESMAHTPMWIPYSMLVVSGALMVIHGSKNIVEDITGMVKLKKDFYKSYMLPILAVLTVVVVAFVLKSRSALIIMTVLLVYFLALGVPVTHALGLASMIAILNLKIIGVTGLSNKMWNNINKYSLLAIPLFIVSGNIMAKGNLGKRLLDLAAALMKRVNGGYAIAILLASIYFGAISGAAAAAAAAIGTMGLPLLVDRKYPKEFGAGLIAAGGTLATIIPPSSILILYAATAECSVTDMFTAGIVPGVVVGIVLVIYVYIVSRAKRWDAPETAFSWKEVWNTTKNAAWAILMPVAILGSIYGGICTATEAAAVSVVYAALVCKFIYKDVTWKDLAKIMVDSVKTSAFIFAITMTASLFSYLITMEQFPQTLSRLMLNGNIGKYGFLLIFNLILFLLGFFMTPGPIILIIIPIALPIAKALGINPVHLGIMATINMQLALITPPVGTNIYVLSSVGKMPVQSVIKGLMPFVAILFIGLVIVALVPWFSLCLI